MTSIVLGGTDMTLWKRKNDHDVEGMGLRRTENVPNDTGTGLQNERFMHGDSMTKTMRRMTVMEAGKLVPIEGKAIEIFAGTVTARRAPETVVATVAAGEVRSHVGTSDVRSPL